MTIDDQSQSMPSANAVTIHGVLDAVQATTANGYQCVPATYIADSYYPQIETGLPLIIMDISSLDAARQIKRSLLQAYSSNHLVTWVECATRPPQSVQTVMLENLEETIPQITKASLYVPPLPSYHSFSALQEIIAHLRSPQGCPWDRVQTLATMRHDLLSECAEAIEAIDVEIQGANNSGHIAEELGDLIMAAVLMVQIATDEKRFQMGKVIHNIVTKLIRRHPHVFANQSADGVQAVLANWDAIKAQEKADAGESPAHPLEGVPAALPALEKARQLQAKADKAGWLSRESLAQAISAQLTISSAIQSELEFGELLWQLVALAHQFNINAEDALRSYTVQYRTTHAV